jgi:antitoxin component YwqK of YwqJK toxin-antitoxin module
MGKQTVYYKNSTVERILEMKNGKEHVMFVMFYSDGEKYVEQFYENGNPIGTWYRWDKNGDLVETIEYK